MANLQTYNLTEYNGDSIVITCVVLLVTSWIAVALRSYTRVVLMKSYQADDWLMLVAQVSTNAALLISLRLLF
jgi:hypothetical protein